MLEAERKVLHKDLQSSIEDRDYNYETAEMRKEVIQAKMFSQKTKLQEESELKALEKRKAVVEIKCVSNFNTAS